MQVYVVSEFPAAFAGEPQTADPFPQSTRILHFASEVPPLATRLSRTTENFSAS